MSHHDKQQKPASDNRQKPRDDKQKSMTEDKDKQQQQHEPMPRADERGEQKLADERSDKDSIGRPVQLDREHQ